MKTLIIFTLALPLMAQSPRPIHPNFHSIVSAQAIINKPFTVKLPALKGETGCGMQVYGMRIPNGDNQHWKLENGTFTGTPTLIGFYRLALKCTTPQPASQMIMLRVSATPPPKPAPVTPPPSIPLN